MAEKTEKRVQAPNASAAFGIQIQEIYERLKHLETCVSSRYPNGYVPVKKLHRMQQDLLEFRLDFARSAPSGTPGLLQQTEPATRSAYFPSPGGKRTPYGDLVESRSSTEAPM